MIKIQNFIDGKLVAPASGTYFENIEPATGKPYSHVPESDRTDLDLAVAAAKRALPAWRALSAVERGAKLIKLSELIHARFEEFARAESIDTGKPITLARATDITRAVGNLKGFGEAGSHWPSTQTFDKGTFVSHTERSPIGIVGIISPWNLPLLLFTWKTAPALVTGTCVIAKPSEVTPMTAFLLSQLISEAGFPAGVFNILHGHGGGIGAAMTDHPDITAISFTGGTATGLQIYQGAAKHLKKVSLELGGKNPTIIFADADFDKAVEGAAAAAFTNQGQVCLCGSRILIEASIYEKFKTALVEKTRAITIGDPLDETTAHGATVSKAHMEKVLGYIDLAKQEGGNILVGGKRRMIDGRCMDGYFIEPTLIEGLPASCRTNLEEIFGPVATLIPFTTEEEALAIANGTQYGLAASVWTLDSAKAARVASRIESGIVWQNCWNIRDIDTPFGGMKKSGIGREGKQRAMEFFTDEKTITIWKNA